MNYWNAWRKEGTSNVTLIQDEMNVGASSGANFYQMKGVDDLGTLYVYQGETDWIEIRLQRF